MKAAPADPVNDLQQAIGRGGSALFDTVPFILRKVIEDKAWADRCDKDGIPFASFEAFVTCKLWHGLESTIDDLIAYCRNHPEVQALIRGEVAGVGKRGTNQHTAGHGVTKSTDGTTATYCLRRLKRDNPELAERVVSGDLSAHAAAILAGFRKATWTAPADAEALAVAVARRFPGWVMVRDSDIKH